MKPTPGYVLRDIQGSHYILPYGQNIALYKRGIHLNDTGVLLWNALHQGMDSTDLLSLLITHYQADASMIPMLQSDIDSFLEQLLSHNILSKDTECSACNHYFRIGGIVIGYQGPDILLHPSLMDFECNEDYEDQHWSILSYPPSTYPIGDLLIKTSEIEIFMNHDHYIITLSPSKGLTQITVSLDGKVACFYCSPPYNNELCEQLFHAFRHAYLILAQKKGIYAIHSSSILYKDRAWLFSAPSGTGKSTLSGYWQALFQVPVINGDLNLVSIDNSKPTVWGLPWCGTSGIYSSEKYPLGGITLLKQHSQNLVHDISKADQQLSIAQRLISPAWTEEMFDLNLSFSGKLIEYITVFRYLCKNEPDAARIMQQYIDQY